MIEYQENEGSGCKDNILSQPERRSLQAMQAPAGLGDRIHQRLLELHPVMHRFSTRQLMAAGLLGFLSFFGAQVLVTQLGPVPARLSIEAANPASGMQTAETAAQHHLSAVALLSDSDYFVDTLSPAERSPVVTLATYMHERGAKQ